MKSIKTTIILLAALLSLGSCAFLDKEPTSATSDTYLKTETEATSFLKGIYAIITQQSYYGGNYFHLVGGDDLEHYGGSGRAPIKRWPYLQQCNFERLVCSFILVYTLCWCEPRQHPAQPD